MPAVKHEDAKEEKAAAAKPQGYVVAHTMVDDWPQGTALTAEQLKDFDVERLVAIGAIEKVGESSEPTAAPGEAVPPPSEPLPN